MQISLRVPIRSYNNSIDISAGLLRTCFIERRKINNDLMLSWYINKQEAQNMEGRAKQTLELSLLPW